MTIFKRKPATCAYFAAAMQCMTLRPIDSTADAVIACQQLLAPGFLITWVALFLLPLIPSRAVANQPPSPPADTDDGWGIGGG